MPYLDILYQDDHLIAVNKPSGLLVHPSWIAPRKSPNLVYSLKRYFRGAPVYTIHRLDRATSGVILFAKDKETAKALNQQFLDKTVKKTYLCVTRGFTPENGVIDYALKPIFDKKESPLADPDKPPKDAVSVYRRLGTVELPIPISKYPVARYSLVEVKPETGRKHQIRRHMKHIFHPLVGDTKHGEGRHNRLFREHFDSHRLLLMATELTFTHPVTQASVTVKAPVTEKVANLFDRLGWQGLYPAPKPEAQQIEALAGAVDADELADSDDDNNED